jgi:outer membrane biosynthesis protein TonB
MTLWYFIRRAASGLATVFASVLLCGCAAGEPTRGGAFEGKQIAEPALVIPFGATNSLVTNKLVLPAATNQVAQATGRRVSRLDPQNFKTDMFKRQQRYDGDLRSRVNGRWRSLLDAASPPVPAGASGVVTVGFRLLQDGHISDIRVVHTTVDDRLTTMCQSAILESAPFEPYPSLGHVATNSYREISFDFKYE